MKVKKQRNQPAKAVKSDPESRLQSAWQKVERFQKKNEKLKEELKSLTDKVRPLIAPTEEALTSAIWLQTDKALIFLGRKSLPKWCKIELVHWLTDNISMLVSHPFSGHLDLSDLQNRMYESIRQEFTLEERYHLGCATLEECEQIEEMRRQAMQSAMDAKKQAPPPKSRMDKHKEADIEDMFSELFDEFDDQDPLHDKPRRSRPFTQEDFSSEGEYEAFMEYEETLRDLMGDEYEYVKEEVRQEWLDDRHDEVVTDKWLKQSHINKLFRKIAQTIHPDREPDAELRQQKTAQMGALVEARDSKDIAAIFQLYTTHIGKLPDELFGGDINKIISLLLQQVEGLKDEHERILYSDPLGAKFHELFKSKNKKLQDKKIAEYIKHTRKVTAGQKAIIKDMRNIEMVKYMLEERSDMRREEDFFDDF